MPKFRELRVNVRVSPEAILGGILGGAASIQAEQVTRAEAAQEHEPVEQVQLGGSSDGGDHP